MIYKKERYDYKTAWNTINVTIFLTSTIIIAVMLLGIIESIL